MEHLRVWSFVAVFALTACAGSSRAARVARHDRSLVTRDDIARTGTTNAWDALRASGTYLSLAEGRGGTDARASYRGRGSFLISSQVLLVLDDVMMLDLGALRDVRADRVDWIRILSGVEATALYGTAGGNGAIVVKTFIPE